MAGLETLAVAADEAQKLTLIHPSTGQPLRDVEGNEAHIMLLGIDSQEAQRFRRQETKRALERRNRRNASVDELEASAVEQLTVLTKGWHLVNFAGEKVDFDFSPQNARTLYSNPAMAWIRNQVDEFVGDRAVFLPGSSTT